jgi:CheY-like chemotaxis protein
MRVLLVDDSVAIHKVAKLGLGAFPATELRICDSVAQLDSTIGNFEPEIVIVSDVMALNKEKSDKSGGPERVLERLIKSKANVIVLTESAESDERLRAQGYPSLLRKPFKLTEFRELVGQINGRTEIQSAATSDENIAPEVTIDLKALGFGVKKPDGADLNSRTGRASEPAKTVTDSRTKEKVAAPTTAPTTARAVSPASAVAVPPRATASPSAPSLAQASAAPPRADGDVRALVEKYLNQNWALFTKSLTANVQKSIEQDRSALIDAEFQDLKQRLSSELGGLIRNETEAALRSWMGEFSRDVLKEVAREELQKLLESED